MLRLSGAFVTRFYEEWEASGAAMLHVAGSVTHGERHHRVERFLDIMQRDLVEVLLPPAVENAKPAKESSENA